MVDTLAPNMHVPGPDDLDGLPILAETMFADHKGVYKPRIEKKQRKLAEKLSFLKEFLEEGEQLLAVTTAVSPTSFIEQWTTGFIFVYIKRCILVFTDRRVFHIPTRTNFGYRGSIAQIRYGDLESIEQKRSWLKISYKAGEKDQFLYLRRSERKKIRALLQSVNLQGSTSIARGRVHLCPKCTSVLETDKYECANCGQEFKNRKRALKLSMWVPGGGYFYTGHTFLGLADAVVETALIFAIIVSLGNIGIASALAGFLIVEKLITIYHANHFVKEYIPKDEKGARDGPVKKTLKWAGMTIGLVFVASMIFGVLMDMGVVPSDRVLGPGDIPQSHYGELMAEGIIGKGEEIEFFFSEGLTSIRAGGSILTNIRVITYQEDDDGLVDVYEIWNQDIASVTLTQQGSTTGYSVYRVLAYDEEVWLELWLPHEYGDGARFAAAVEAKIGK